MSEYYAPLLPKILEMLPIVTVQSPHHQPTREQTHLKHLSNQGYEVSNLLSRSVLSNSLRPHGLQHARLPFSQSLLKLMSIQPTHPLSFPSPPTFNLSQHQGLFQWVCSSHQVAKVLGVSALASVLPKNIFSWSSLGLTDLISLQSKGLSRVSSNNSWRKASIWKYQFFSTQPSLWSTSTSIHDYWKNHSFDYTDLCWQSNVSGY